MADDVVSGSEPRDELVAAIRRAFEDRDGVEVARTVEALRRVDPDHPDVHLASAHLLESQGRPIDGAAHRIRGYDRALELGWEVDTFQPLLRGLLESALAHVEGLAIVRPAALASSNADVLRAFVALASDVGSLDEARRALVRLETLPTGPLRDLEDAIAFAERIDDAVRFASDGTLVRRSEDGGATSLHHSIVTQALIGAAASRSLTTAAFGASVPDVLRAMDLWSEASARGSLLHLLKLGRDDAAMAFFDRARPWLARATSIDLLGEAVLSCVKRGAVVALPGYAERLDEVSGCRLASLTRLASLVGADAERIPLWAEILRDLYEAAATRSAAAAAAARETTPWNHAHDFLLARDRSPEDGRIDVFLKCVKRPFDITPFVMFWLECFSDASRYRIRLLDDSGLDIKGAFPHASIEDTSGLRDGLNPWVPLIRDGRRPVNLLGWESVANLTPFVKTRSEWFWNIDADDIRPLLDQHTTMEDVRAKLRAVERHAERAGLTMVSYDLWASLHWLLEHGYHWTFGICLCRNDPHLLGAMTSSFDAADVPSFPINIDHLLSRLSDGTLRGGLLSDHFASFALDGTRILQLDPRGREYYHSSRGTRKRFDFHLDPGPLVQHLLHEKTLVV